MKIYQFKRFKLKIKKSGDYYQAYEKDTSGILNYNDRFYLAGTHVKGQVYKSIESLLNSYKNIYGDFTIVNSC